MSGAPDIHRLTCLNLGPRDRVWRMTLEEIYALCCKWDEHDGGDCEAPMSHEEFTLLHALRFWIEECVLDRVKHALACESGEVRK